MRFRTSDADAVPPPPDMTAMIRARFASTEERSVRARPAESIEDRLNALIAELEALPESEVDSLLSPRPRVAARGYGSHEVPPPPDMTTMILARRGGR